MEAEGPLAMLIKWVLMESGSDTYKAIMHHGLRNALHFFRSGNNWR